MSWMTWMALLLSASILSSFTFVLAQSQSTGNSPQNSWPHVYPGMPTGDYSPEWQSYFEVTEPLPNVTWPLARNWAGNIAVQRPGHPNDTLYFWAFESLEGSFTAEECEKPWGIWLNGGPGDSSLYGLLFENGPIHILSDYSVVENNYSWTNVADYVWVDQPVGTGFSTVDPDGLVADEEQVATDFMGFLENFVKVFPSLASRPLYISGESYAGKYIPYIAKAYFEMDNPPVNLAGIAIGDGTIGSLETYLDLPVVSVLQTYPQIIGYDTQVFEYFEEQSAICGYNLTLQYPQPEHFPTLNGILPSAVSGLSDMKLSKRGFVREVRDRHVAKAREQGGALKHRERLRARDAWKRDLTGRPNGTLDPWYLCDLYFEMVDYADNFTFPWFPGGMWDPYDVTDALNPEATADASVFLNNNRTRAALHAPTSKDWALSTLPVFAPSNRPTDIFGDSSVEPMAFLSDLATNATANDVRVIIYSGNDDSIISHFGSQIVIQNTTFGGTQGFTRKPETPWYNDAGEFAGIIHQERGWTYVLVDHAGHLLGRTNPISALTLAREFIFGYNPTGLVLDDGLGPAVVVGGEDPALGGEILRGQAGIYYGSATTASTYFFPTATVEAWDHYIATATVV